MPQEPNPTVRRVTSTASWLGFWPGTLYKTEQIQNTLAWLCGGKLPVYAQSTGRMGCSLWEDETTGERAVFLYNTDFDDAENTLLHTDGVYTAELLTPSGWQLLGTGDVFTLPHIPAWTTAALRLRKN